MTTEEKIKFVMEVLEKASQQYLKTPIKYDFEEEAWIDRYITKSNMEGSLRAYKANLESAYQAALRIKEKAFKA